MLAMPCNGRWSRLQSLSNRLMGRSSGGLLLSIITCLLIVSEIRNQINFVFGLMSGLDWHGLLLFRYSLVVLLLHLRE